jgi:two-component system, sensor histidine kinase and response regulator
MKKRFASINNFLYGPEKSVILEEKMLLAANLIGLIASIIGGFMNLFLGYSIPALIMPLILGLILVILFYYIRFKKKYTKLVFPIIIFSFLGIGLIWIFNGGYNGSNTLVLFTIFVLALCITPNNKFTFLYFFFISLLVFLHFFQFFRPDDIKEFPTKETRFIDLVITVVYTSSFIYLMISILIKNFRFERDVSNERGRKLEELNSKLRFSNSAKDKLFSIIAHDLKGPFNTILGFSELSLKELHGGDTVAAQNHIEEGMASTKRTLVLLENLLAWSKSQRGQIEFKPENLNLQSLIEEVIHDMDSTAKIKSISLIYFQAEPVAFFADKNMMQTIFRNLVSNAIKFTNPGGKIRIYGKSDNGRTEITVSDNGIGMPESTLDSLFSIDTNKPSLGTANEKGSGLGLILCKEFVKKHKGTIHAESEFGKGSKFVVTLPQ